MKASFESVVRNALSGMEAEPRSLPRALKFYADQTSLKVGNAERDLIARLSGGPNDPVKKELQLALARWDWANTPEWGRGTEANTLERRTLVYRLLGIGKPLQKVMNDRIPHAPGNGNTVISAPDSGRPWYTPEFRLQHSFYWKNFEKFLLKSGKFSDKAILSMDSATTSIMERLPDPARPAAFSARGLIVGYVQSGKTTNFTGVIAKAVDAGYRLIIVLSGTTNLLRNQTQRRIDRDLVGVENILGSGTDGETYHDYQNDPDWPGRFISYGGRPGMMGSVNILRLTGKQDFDSPDVGINPLEFEFEKLDKQKPLYDRENLDHAGARVIVIKKQRERLNRLIRDLRAIGKSQRNEIPALIIDDESDQASVNTVNPKSASQKKRSSINAALVKILGELPRAQYLGYTATPFANVFVNLHDAEDIYPKDFIVALDRPAGYMGATDFVDLEPAKLADMANSRAYVRDIPAANKPDDDRLQEALDLFVLTGAIKKYREKRTSFRFKHHTMLVHQSPLTKSHALMVERVQSLWEKSAWSAPATKDRLKGRIEDLRKVWEVRGRPLNLPFPKNLDDLATYISEARAEIEQGGPVMMVNGAEGGEAPDFDAKEGVWKIIVGGAKLSRGYTVEDLTISYFRRSAKLQDTLMQMGRWFGFRAGYGDLIRLFIGRAERDGKKKGPDGKPRTFDLYRAFEAMCRDEKDFREQLVQYSKDSGITPKDIPALVFNSHPQLRPSSRNKMFNTELTWAGFTYREPTSPASIGKGRRDNFSLFEKLLAKHPVQRGTVNISGEKKGDFDILWTRVTNTEVLATLKAFQWAGESPIRGELAYLEESPVLVDNWLIIAPQISAGKAGACRFGKVDFSVFARGKLTDTRFGVFSSPGHVDFAKSLLGQDNPKIESSLKRPSGKTGVLLLYPTLPRSEIGQKGDLAPVIGFSMTVPESARSTRVGFKPRDSRHPDSVVVTR